MLELAERLLHGVRGVLLPWDVPAPPALARGPAQGGRRAERAPHRARPGWAASRLPDSPGEDLCDPRLADQAGQPEGALRCVALVGCTVHEAHLAAAAALAAHDAVRRVTALVHVQGVSKAAPTVAALLQTLRRSRASPALPGAALQGVVRTERQP